MQPKPPFGPLTNAQVFALGRLAHLREFDFGDPCLPLWVVESPLREAPYQLDGPAFDREMDALAAAGWIEWKKPEQSSKDAEESESEPDDEEETEDAAKPETTPSAHAAEEVRATDALMEQLHALRAELRQRQPNLPTELGSLVLLSDIVRSPDGLDLEDLQRALEEPPCSLSEQEAFRTYRRMVKGHWVLDAQGGNRDDLWYPSPFTWAHVDAIDAALQSREAEMRSRIVEGNADALELPAASALRKALKEVDRALFVPDSHRRLAYRNRPAPIAFDAEGDSSTTTSSPNVCALVVHQLAVEPGNRVLVCGVKAGFTAALCAHIVGPKGRVICLETNPLIVEHARASIKRAGFERRVEVRLVKDVTVGLPDQEPWDAVVVNGKIPKVPRPIIRQMAEGGRMLIFLQDGDSTAQTAFLIRKNGKAVDNKELSSFLFTPIYGEYGYDPPNWPDDLHLVGQEEHDVFVSYSTQDQDECDRIVQAFEAAGLRCWMSGRNHPVGKDGYEQAIMDALKRAQVFLIVLSHQSLASDHVKNELTNATSLRKTILPLRLSECPARLPSNFQYHLERHQQFDFDKHAMDEVVAAALLLVGGGAAATPRQSSETGAAPSAIDTPTAGASSDARGTGNGAPSFDALLAETIADGRITGAEMKLLVHAAVEGGLADDAAAARAYINQIAREKSPNVKLPK